MITQSQKDQIRKMAEEDLETLTKYEESAYFRGAEAVLLRMDIDVWKVEEIILLLEFEKISYEQAKQQILNAIRISG